MINVQKLHGFLLQHPVPACFEAYLNSSAVSARMKLRGMTSDKIRDLSLKINGHQEQDEAKGPKESKGLLVPWRRWELGLFVWVVLFYRHVFSKNIQQLNQNDFQWLHSIFHEKSLIRIKHEVYSIFHLNSGKFEWEEEEDQILKSIIHETKSSSQPIEWKIVSFQLFHISEARFFRTYAQCRQRWGNHFDPDIKKQTWEREEDLLLIKQVEEVGKKWSAIAKMFKGRRTQHMVKNRYNSLIKKWRGKGQPLRDSQIHRKMINYWEKYEEKKANQTLPEENNGKQMVIQCHLQKQKEALQDPNAFIDEVLIKSEEGSEMEYSKGQSAYLRLPSLLPDVQEEFEESQHNIFMNRLGKERRIDWKDDGLREVVDDVVNNLGCGHPQLLDMFFNSQEDEPFDLAMR